MKKFILISLVFLSCLSLIIRFGLEPLTKYFGFSKRAGIRIESNIKSKVFINGVEAGFTPFQDDNLTEGEYKVLLKSEEASPSGKTWQGLVRLNSGTLSVINRELSDSATASSGEVITLEEGKGVTIISIPSEAQVEINGQIKGRTPMVVYDLGTGEHQFLVSKDDYLKRNIRINLVEGYNLNIFVDLAIAQADLTKITTVPVSGNTTITIKKTSTGFLRVRSEPSLNSKEIARVKPGEEFVLIEELPSWVKIRLPDGRDGYVSNSFTQKKN